MLPNMQFRIQCLPSNVIKAVNVYNTDFTFCFMCIRNLVSNVKGKTLWVFENSVLRRISGASRDEMTMKPHNEGRHGPCSALNVITIIKWSRMIRARHAARMLEIRNAYKMFTVKPGGKRPLVKPWDGWEDGTKIHLKRNRVWGCGLDPYGSEKELLVD
jgi:hypothetical protein